MFGKGASVVPGPCQALGSQIHMHCALGCCGQRNDIWFTVDGGPQLILDPELLQFMAGLKGWAPHSFTLLLKKYGLVFVRASLLFLLLLIKTLLGYKGFSLYNSRIQGWASTIYLMVWEVVFFLTSCLSYDRQPHPICELKMASRALSCTLGKLWITEHLLFSFEMLTLVGLGEISLDRVLGCHSEDPGLDPHTLV